ncbi:MAG: DUF4365 domain-containing protein [Lentisphaeria bacterium]
MDKNWERLNHLQVGRYAEYLFKINLVSYGLDVYSSEVDDHGIDFVVRGGDRRYFDIQVKSIRGKKYIFFPKLKFEIRDNLFAAIIVFIKGEDPYFFMIPSTAWLTPNALLVDRKYEKLASKPEYGLNISQKKLAAFRKVQH